MTVVVKTKIINLFIFMKKEKTFILILILLLMVNIKGYSQNDTIKLGEVEVSSPANRVLFKETSRFVQIIPKKEIQQAPVNTIGDILQQLAGFDMRQRGSFGMQSDLTVRGGTFNQNLILINGIPVNDPQTGHHNLDFALPVNDIKKVEIIQGPASRWFGPNAYSGGINIITTPLNKNQVISKITVGQFGLIDGLLSGNYLLGKIKNLSSVQYLKSDGYQQDTDFKNLNLFHQSVYQKNNTKIDFQITYQDKAFGAYGFYTGKYPNEFEHIKSLFSSLYLSTGNIVKVSGSIAVKRLYDRFELFRQGKNWYEKQGLWFVMGNDSAGFHTPNGFFPYKGPNFHRTDMLNINGKLKFNTLIGKTTIGINYNGEKILSNVLGDKLNDTIYSSFDEGAYYNNSAVRNNFNISVNQYYGKNKFNMSAGINGFYNSNYGVYLSPGIDLGYFFLKNMKAFISFNNAIRLPTFTDLYYKGPDHISNPQLKPETVSGMELGVKLFFNEFYATISFFNRIGKNTIDWIKTDINSKWESKNITNLNTYGFSFSAIYKPEKRKIKKYIHAIRFNYTQLESSKSADNFITLYSLEYLKYNVNIFMENPIFRNVSMGWDFSIQKRNGDYLNYSAGKLLPFKTVYLLNLKVNYKYKKIKIFIQEKNLFNMQYHDIGSVVLPGTWIMGGVQYQFQL